MTLDPTSRETSATRPPVLVVIGTGGMGIAVSQRLGSGKLILLADVSSKALEIAASQLEARGHKVTTQQVDITTPQSVAKLASHAAELGRLETVVHTAGLSPTMASASKIYAVDLVGTANIIDTFQHEASPGMSLTCIASISGHFAHLSSEDETHLSQAPVEDLLACAAININSDDPVKAYEISKRANILRVRAAAKSYGSRMARVNSISPGIIATPMARQELAGPSGDNMRRLIATSPVQRMGTADDIADVVAFLSGSTASFITGTDLLVDGGVVASFVSG